jgi:sortase family protein
MSWHKGLEGGAPDGAPPSADVGFRYWRGKIASALLVLVAAISAGVVTAPPPGLSVFQSEAIAGAFAQPYADSVQAAPHAGATATPTVAATAAPTPSPSLVCPAPSLKKRRGVPSSWPIAIQIPSIGVDAAVELAAIDKHGDMQVPVNPCDVAWYKLGPVPGAAGDAVIDGHLDWWTDGAAVFWKLNLVKPGAQIIIIDAGGAKLRFKVTTLDRVRRATEPAGLFTTTGTPTLTLYTCAGVWETGAQTYSQRLFVNAVPVH